MKTNWKLKAVIAALPILILVGCGSDDDDETKLNQALVRQHSCSLPTNNASQQFGTTTSTPIATFTLPSELKEDEDTRVNVQLSLQNGFGTFGTSGQSAQTIAMNARATSETNVRLTGSGITIAINSSQTVTASGVFNGVTLGGSKHCTATTNSVNNGLNTGFSNGLNTGANGIGQTINPLTGQIIPTNTGTFQQQPQLQYFRDATGRVYARDQFGRTFFIQ